MSLFKHSFRLLSVRSFHTQPVLQEWSKNYLKKMKKENLIQLAKEHHIKNVLVTKNEIINQLLDLKSPSKSSVPESSVDTAKITKEAGFSSEKPKENIPTFDDKTPVFEDQPPMEKPIMKEPIVENSTAKKHIEQPIVKEPVFEQPIIEEPVVEEPVVEEPVVEEPVVEEPVVEEPVVEILVEEPIFKEQNVESELKSSLDEQSTDNQNKKTIDSEKVLEDNMKTKNKSSSPLMNATIGSSLLLWYFGGQDAFIKIWDFF
ncbi:hypothetical protein G6F56_007545 [Rhizopus delemar]|nr:hypothetical protein G6F56_007545 [Rhizopus delemar]